jgi:hypothetical protein
VWRTAGRQESLFCQVPGLMEGLITR